MRSPSLGRTPNLVGEHVISVREKHYSSDGPGAFHLTCNPNTGCICSDGQWHLCLECPEENECTLPWDKGMMMKRGVKKL